MNLPNFAVGTIQFINKLYYTILLVHILTLYYCHHQYIKEKQLNEEIKYWENTEDTKNNSGNRNGNLRINGNNFKTMENQEI